MAAPQRRYGASAIAEARRSACRKGEGGAAAGGPAARQKAASRRRRFAVVVVIPVLLMLGSVYLHTVSAVLTDKAAYLDERLAEVRAKGERLEVRGRGAIGGRKDKAPSPSKSWG